MSDTRRQETAHNKLGDELKLSLEADHEQEVYTYDVVWRGHCGYFSVIFSCETPEDAMALFTALQTIHEVDIV